MGENVRSGLSVFVIAVPLCLGIAISSGFPPVAGLVTAMVGGLVTSPIGSAPLTIKGPAAGLISVSLGAVQQLGYERALAAGVAAALLQILLALLKAGRFANVVPPAVLRGVLCSVGVVIFAKQLPPGLGIKHVFGGPFETLTQLPAHLAEANSIACLIFAISLLIVLSTPQLPSRRLAAIPAPLLVLGVAVPLAWWLRLDRSQFVRLPGSLSQAVQLPDFSGPVLGVLVFGLQFALIGSMESLLSVKVRSPSLPP